MATQPPAKQSDARRVLAAVAAIGLLVVVADLLLAIGLFRGRNSQDTAPRSSLQVREILDRAIRADAERSILLVGDSVLAGDVLGDERLAWRSQRVIDHLRGEENPTSRTAFHQVASNALLPSDLERIVAELEVMDPEARIELLVQLGPRHWSPIYADSDACSQAFFCRLPGLDENGDVTPARLQRASDRLRGLLPIWRHRQSLGADAGPPLAGLTNARAGGSEADPALGLARIQGHYRGDVRQPSAQLDALDRVLKSLERSGRRALFFTTPIRDDFIDAIVSPEQLGDQYARLAHRVHQMGGPAAHFASFDHPLFQKTSFIDHVHLDPAGNRLLAINLLAELGIGLARPPDATGLIYDHGIDRSLVTSVDAGHANGPPWIARFDSKSEIAFDPQNRRLVISDAESHGLRVMRGGLRSVEPWAGVEGQAGDADGSLDEARFDRPHAPVVVAGRVALIDGGGTRIREISQGAVRTLTSDASRRWSALASDGSRLYGLDHTGAVHHIDADGVRLILEPPVNPIRLSNLAVSSQGDIFVADRRQVFAGQLDPKRPLSFEDLDPLLTGAEARQGAGQNLPAAGQRFPMPLEDVRFSHINALIWVERYRGLLISDEVDLGNAGEASPASERAHLRFLDPNRQKLFPWLKPYVNGNAYFPPYQRARQPASAFHVSRLALDPETCDLYLLERERSRLIRIGDGLFGAARISDSEASLTSPFGRKSSREILATYHPERFRAERAAREGLRGSLIGVHGGSSMIVAADHHGYYSLARAIERDLARDLLLGERLQADLIPLSHPSAGIRRAAELAASFMRNFFVPDFMLVDANDLTRVVRKEIESGDTLNGLSQVAMMAADHDAEFIVIDDSGLGGRGRDGLLPRSQTYLDFLDLIRRSGIEIVEPTRMLLPALLDVSPWGNLPHRRDQHHGSPQAIDRTARQIAAQLAPILSSHFARTGQREGRAPAAQSPVVQRDLRSTLRALGGASNDPPPRLPSQAARALLEGRSLDVILDVGRIEALGLDVPASKTGVAAVLRTFVEEDVRGRMADDLRVRFVRFASYDEYGLGSLEGAEILFEAHVDADSIASFWPR